MMLVSVLMPVFTKNSFCLESIESILCSDISQFWTDYCFQMVQLMQRQNSSKICSQRSSNKNHHNQKSGLVHMHLTRHSSKRKILYCWNGRCWWYFFNDLKENHIFRNILILLPLGFRAELIDEYGQSLDWKSFPSQPKILYAPHV